MGNISRAVAGAGSRQSAISTLLMKTVYNVISYLFVHWICWTIILHSPIVHSSGHSIFLCCGCAFVTPCSAQQRFHGSRTWPANSGGGLGCQCLAAFSSIVKHGQDAANLLDPRLPSLEPSPRRLLMVCQFTWAFTILASGREDFGVQTTIHIASLQMLLQNCHASYFSFSISYNNYIFLSSSNL